MFEGVPSYPDAGRLWRMVDKYTIAQLYTAPTAIRALMREGGGAAAGDEPLVAQAARLGRGSRAAAGRVSE